MADTALPAYTGVNFSNLRKALYLMYFGTDGGKSEDFSSPKYQYILPMQGNFVNPLNGRDANDTYMLYWIERDESLTRDDYVEDGEDSYNRQKCVASVLIRFVGRQAENWVRTFRHLAKRSGVTAIWAGVCNAEKLEYTSPVVPYSINYFGKNNDVAFDIRFKLYYDECISTGWKPLTGIDLRIQGNLSLEGNIQVESK